MLSTASVCFRPSPSLLDRFESRQRLGFLLFEMSAPALEPTQPLIQWVLGALLEVKLPGHDVDRLFPLVPCTGFHAGPSGRAV